MEVLSQKYCGNCGEGLKGKNNFCHHCGEPVENGAKKPFYKKSGVIISLAAGMITLCIGVLLFFNLNSSNDNLDAVANNDENGSNDTEEKLTLEERFPFVDDLLTWDEMAEVVQEIKNENEGIEDREIAEKIEEEYGKYNERAFSSGFIIDDEMSEEDKEEVLLEMVTEGSATKIVNPIDNEFGNKEENRYKKIDELLAGTHNYVEDTEGFYDFNGIQLGYPSVIMDELYVFLHDDDDVPYVDLDIQMLFDKDVRAKDLGKLYKKLDEIDVNGNNFLKNSTLMLSKTDDGKESDYNEVINWYKSEFEDDETIFHEGEILDVMLSIPVENVFGKQALDSLEDFRSDSDSLEGNLKLYINETEIMNKELGEDGISDGDAVISTDIKK